MGAPGHPQKLKNMIFLHKASVFEDLPFRPRAPPRLILGAKRDQNRPIKLQKTIKRAPRKYIKRVPKELPKIDPKWEPKWN